MSCWGNCAVSGSRTVAAHGRRQSDQGCCQAHGAAFPKAANRPSAESMACTRTVAIRGLPLRSSGPLYARSAILPQQRGQRFFLRALELLVVEVLVDAWAVDE